MLRLLRFGTPYVRVDEDVSTTTIRKLDRHLLLLLIGVTFFSYADRSNIGYAANDLCRQLDLTHEEYGQGVSLFYVGYVLSQVLGNVMLKRMGAPLWVACIVFAWGCVAAALGFTHSGMQFYLLRVLLGAAEGGTFPAIWYIISLFYPPECVTGAYSVIMATVSFSMPLSSPLAAGLLSLGPYLNIEGWRLLFVVEGIMPMIFAVFLFFFLPTSPQTASFLEAEEKEWLALKWGSSDASPSRSFWKELKTVVGQRAWGICSLCALISFGINSILMFWATLIIHDMLYGDEDEDPETCGSEHGNAALAILLTAIPFLISGLCCLLMRRYDVKNRVKVSSVFYLIGSVVLVSWSLTQHAGFILRFLLLTAAITMGFVVFPYITALAITSCEASVHSLASSLFNTTATIGAIAFPMIFGKLMDVVGSNVAIAIFGGVNSIAALLILCMTDPLTKEPTKKATVELGYLQTSTSNA